MSLQYKQFLRYLLKENINSKELFTIWQECIEAAEEISYDQEVDYTPVHQFLAQHEQELDLDEIDFENAPTIMTVKINGALWVLDFENKKFDTARDWLYWVDDSELDNYVNTPERQNFWDGVTTKHPFWSSAYHVTDEDNVESILAQGLKQMDKSRGLTNRGVPAAVFASMERDFGKTYGDATFQIDLSSMKSDGYTPEIENEPGFNQDDDENLRASLAWKIGYDEYEREENNDTSEDTIIIYGEIPPKYLKLLED